MQCCWIEDECEPVVRPRTHFGRISCEKSSLELEVAIHEQYIAVRSRTANMPILIDQRTMPPALWNVDFLCRTFGVQPPNSRETVAIDQFIYQGYRQAGRAFLSAIEGRFAVAHHDPDRKIIFFARDWIGEQPFHWMATHKAVIVANMISEVMQAAGDLYDYRYARAFPQARYLEIDVSQVDDSCVSETLRYRDDAGYFDLEDATRDSRNSYRDIGASAERACGLLHDSVKRRLSALGGGEQHVLLSGGLDSLSVALTLRSLGVPCIAHTLAIGEGGDDVSQAAAFARTLGIPHRVTHASVAEVRAAVRQVIPIAETYHLYNLYCAVGMHLLGKDLSGQGVTHAWCGEAVNEALGDYHDWTILDPVTGGERILQRVNHERMKHPAERLLYVWGQSRDRGKYNRQFGTGLAKHAGARMVKPFARWNIALECPYYDRDLLATLIAVPAGPLDELGGKPGLFLHMFHRLLDKFNFPEELVTNCRKVRLQDASEGGRGGITPILISIGLDQERLISLFNHQFHSDLNARLEARRLAGGTLEFEL